jgi:hypothetical protein
VRRDLPQGQDALQFSKQRQQAVILRGGEIAVVDAFELDADGEIVAALAAAPARSAGVPGACGERHELQQFTAASDQEMRRHAQAGEIGERGMRRRVQPVGEQALDRVAGVLAARQADECRTTGLTRYPPADCRTSATVPAARRHPVLSGHRPGSCDAEPLHAVARREGHAEQLRRCSAVESGLRQRSGIACARAVQVMRQAPGGSAGRAARRRAFRARRLQARVLDAISPPADSATARSRMFSSSRHVAGKS